MPFLYWSATAKCVGFDDICLRDFLHHARHSHLPLLLTDLALDLRIAFRLLHLVLDFLLRHLEILRRLPFLVGVVEDRDDENDPDDLERHREDDIRNLRKARAEIVVNELRNRQKLMFQDDVQEPADDENPQKRLHELDERPLREDAPDSVDRIQVAELRFDLLRAEDEPDLEEIDREPYEHDADHDGKRRLRENRHHADEEPDDGLRVDRLVHIREDVHRVVGDAMVYVVP